MGNKMNETKKDYANEIKLSAIVARDFELKRTPQGSPVGDLLVRVPFKPKGSQDYASYFLNCVCWGDEALLAADVCAKGAKITLSGYLKGEAWVDKNTGKERTSFKITVTDLTLDEVPRVTDYNRVTVVGDFEPLSTPSMDDIPF